MDKFRKIATVNVVDMEFKDYLTEMFNMGGYNIVQHPEYEEEMDVVIKVENKEDDDPLVFE